MEQIKEDIEICLFDGIEKNTVYTGGLSDLNNVTEWLKWRKDEPGSPKKLKLSEIVEQLKNSEPIITIISESPLSGEIWQYGNYGDGWWKIGTLDGYA